MLDQLFEASHLLRRHAPSASITEAGGGAKGRGEFLKDSTGHSCRQPDEALASIAARRHTGLELRGGIGGLGLPTFMVDGLAKSRPVLAKRPMAPTFSPICSRRDRQFAP